MTPDERIHELLRLEDLKFFERLSNKQKEFEDRRQQLRQEHFSQKRQPANTVALIVDAWQENRRTFVDDWILARQRLAVNEPQLASACQLDKLFKDIERFVTAGQDQRRDKVADFARDWPCSPAAIAALAERSKQTDYGIIANARNRVEQLKIEFRHNLHTVGERMMKIEIKNSTVHQLNLGSILGNMNNAVTTLTQTGHSEVATALKEITERIAATEELVQTTKKDVLENLAFIAQQATLPAAERQEGPIKAVLSHVQAALQIVGPLTQMWNTYGPVILAFFSDNLTPS